MATAVGGALAVAEVASRDESKVPEWVRQSEIFAAYKKFRGRAAMDETEEEKSLAAAVADGLLSEEEGAEMEAVRLSACREEAVRSARLKTNVLLESVRAKHARRLDDALEEIERESRVLEKEEIEAIVSRAQKRLAKEKEESLINLTRECQENLAAKEMEIQESASKAYERLEFFEKKRHEVSRVDLADVEVAAGEIESVVESKRQSAEEENANKQRQMLLKEIATMLMGHQAQKSQHEEAALRARYFDTVRPALSSSEMAPTTATIAGAACGVALSKLAEPETLVGLTKLVELKRFDLIADYSQSLNDTSRKLARDWLTQVEKYQVAKSQQESSDAKLIALAAASAVFVEGE